VTGQDVEIQGRAHGAFGRRCPGALKLVRPPAALLQGVEDALADLVRVSGCRAARAIGLQPA
jgi:hypothetical protein